MICIIQQYFCCTHILPSDLLSVWWIHMYAKLTHHLAADLPFPGLENPDVPEDDDTPEPSSTLPDAPQEDEVSDDLREEHVNALQAGNKECKLPLSYLWM